MSLLAEQGAENWRAIAALLVAGALSACAVNMQSPISPTATAPAPIEMRPLSSTEKTALTKALARTLKEPKAAQLTAQFKWLPVAAHGSGPIGYCGLVRYGGHSEFVRFFALISKGPKGDYTEGRIEHIDTMPNTVGSGTAQEAVETGLTEENCKTWSYTDFSEAT